MGCTNEATLSVSASGQCLLRIERTYRRGLLATETLVVERLYGSAG